jgi:undecaprenyl-diphosphatase
MTVIQALVLGLLQGVTEFLPISSSGHLVLVPWLLGWDPPNLTFDTTVHLGTLLAVVVYFRQDIGQMVRGVTGVLRDRNLQDLGSRLGWLVLIGAIPAALSGFLLGSFFEQLFGTPALVSGLLLVTGLILFLSERMSRQVRASESLTWKDSLLVGLAQAAAIAPGISRSGSTIAAGLALGVRREAAARFSFLIALPVIFGAWVFRLKDTMETGISRSEVSTLAIGFLVAAISGYACIHFLLSYLRRHSLYPFAAYCWGFGLLGLVVALVVGL